ncbi:hypothetical protein ES703_95458 [subsurface metagenome]
MTMPGLITGQPLSGRGVGQALFEFLPCLPHEGPPGMPRVLAKQLFPQGFIPGRFPAAQVPVVQPPPVPPAVTAEVPTPQPAPQPAPRKRVLERGSFPEWH